LDLKLKHDRGATTWKLHIHISRMEHLKFTTHIHGTSDTTGLLAN